jgi:hypothetical protein
MEDGITLFRFKGSPPFTVLTIQIQTVTLRLSVRNLNTGGRFHKYTRVHLRGTSIDGIGFSEAGKYTTYYSVPLLPSLATGKLIEPLIPDTYRERDGSVAGEFEAPAESIIESELWAYPQNRPPPR